MKSNCCNAEVEYTNGGGTSVTHWLKCSKCKQACDVVQETPETFGNWPEIEKELDNRFPDGLYSDGMESTKDVKSFLKSKIAEAEREAVRGYDKKVFVALETYKKGFSAYISLEEIIDTREQTLKDFGIEE